LVWIDNPPVEALDSLWIIHAQVWSLVVDIKVAIAVSPTLQRTPGIDKTVEDDKERRVQQQGVLGGKEVTV
jgi:hypothetical protein